MGEKEVSIRRIAHSSHGNQFRDGDLNVLLAQQRFVRELCVN